MSLGSRIVELRNAQGLSQADLAEAMGVSRQSVSKWETDVSTPDLEKLQNLARYFDLTLDALVYGEAAAAEAGARHQVSMGPEDNTSPYMDVLREVDDRFKVDAPPEARTDPRADVAAASRTNPVNTACPFLSGLRMPKVVRIGVILIVTWAVISALFVVSMGIVGPIYTLPLLVFGLSFCFVKRYPGLLACWVNYLLCSVILHVFTNIEPLDSILTLMGKADVSGLGLVFSYIWLVAIVALVVYTAIACRHEGWKWDVRHAGEVVLAFALLAAGIIWQMNLYILDDFYLLQYLIAIYLQLGGVTLLVMDITKWVSSLSNQ